jgi:3-polyprenyl-4-hydroxybenzoate decarboxylase
MLSGALIPMAVAIGIDVAAIPAAQTAIAETRNTRANERIAALEKQIESLQTKEAKTENTATAT